MDLPGRHRPPKKSTQQNPKRLRPHQGVQGKLVGLYGHKVQLFLVLATCCVVLGPIPSAKHLVERTLTLLSP